MEKSRPGCWRLQEAAETGDEAAAAAGTEETQGPLGGEGTEVFASHCEGAALKNCR